MIIRVLRDDPPKDNQAAIFIMTENDHDMIFFDDLISQIKEYCYDVTGKRITEAKRPKRQKESNRK
jgi:hypothetical protein